MSKARLPTKAVKGGSVGSGRSSRTGPARSASEMIEDGWTESGDLIVTYDGTKGSHRGDGRSSDRPRPLWRQLSEGLRIGSDSHTERTHGRWEVHPFRRPMIPGLKSWSMSWMRGPRRECTYPHRPGTRLETSFVLSSALHGFGEMRKY